MRRIPRKDETIMRRGICLLLCLLLLTGGVPAAAPDTYDAPAWLLADDGDSTNTGNSTDTGDSTDTGNSDTGNSDTGDSTDTGDSGDSGDSDEMVQLTPPVKMGWGRDYHFLMEFYTKQKSDEILKDEEEVDYIPCPGMMYWSIDGDNQRRYAIDLYFDDPEGAPQLVESVKEWVVTGNRTMESNFRFFWSNRLSGDYYFLIRTLGDGIHYSDSEAKQSEVFTYEAPDGQLSRPARPRWKGVSEAATVFIYPPTKDDDEANGYLDSTYRIGYEARWWYAAALTKDDDEDDDTGSTPVVDTGDSGDSGNSDSGDSGNSDTGDSTDTGNSGGNTKKDDYDPTKPVEAGTILTFYPKHFEFKPSEKMLADFGSGYYSVQIRALSGDINKARPSDWSELSMVRHIVAENDDLTTIVDRVDENTDGTNRQLAINNVRKFGTFRLVEMMNADKDNTGAVAAIAQLEDVTGNYAQIVVSGGLSELFPESQINVIGAGLNVDLGEGVVFHLGAAHADEVPSTLYSNAVRFSMQLLDTNGASLTPNSTELRVPAKITLPVPNTINPQFFVILHHRMDGTVETLSNVSLRKVDKQWYASFVVTNFSDFTMAEQNAFLEASKTAAGVSVSYRFKTADVKSAFCAVRDSYGRLLTVAALEASETRKTVQVPCDGAASVKLFLLDGNRVPAFPALTASVK